MDNSDNSLSAIDSIDTVAFKIGLRGYGVDEVDEFLERLSSEVRQLQDLAKQQRQQLRQAAERISQLDARGPTTGPVNVTPAAPAIRTSSAAGPEQVTSMIALAQRFIEQAQQEAEEKAREFTIAAQERAREIVTEARSRAEDEVNRLNGLKQRLSEDVDTLTHQLQAEKARISGVLAEFTRWVESALQAGTPRASTPAPTPPAPTSSSPGASTATLAARPLQTPPPAPAPGSSPSTIGQVLKFNQTSRDDR